MCVHIRKVRKYMYMCTFQVSRSCVHVVSEYAFACKGDVFVEDVTFTMGRNCGLEFLYKPHMRTYIHACIHR